MHWGASLETNQLKDYIFKLIVSLGNCLHVITKDTITACLAYKKDCKLKIMMNHCDDSVTVKELVPVSGKLKKNPLKFHLLSFVHCPSEPLWQGEGSWNRSWPLGCLTLPLWRPPWPTALFFPPNEVGKVNTLVARGRRLSGGLWDRPVVVSGHVDVRQTVAGFELPECVFMEERWSSGRCHSCLHCLTPHHKQI